MELLIFIVLFALWFIWPLAASTIADSKGNSQGLGCLAGFLLGPLGVILVVIASPNQEELNQRQIRAGKMKPCYFCHAPIMVEAQVCRYCGRDLPPYALHAPQKKRFP